MASMTANTQERPRPPMPGTGTIYISPFHDEWAAIWESHTEGDPDSIRQLEGPSGMTRDEAITWARGLAAMGIMIHDGEDWVPVT